MDRVELYKIAEDGTEQKLGVDAAAPFQFHYPVTDEVGQILSFKAKAKDIDGFWSELSQPFNIKVNENKPPVVTIIKPFNNSSSVIEGQSLEVTAEVFDDLGADGVSRVDFYLNDLLVETVYQSVETQGGGFALDHVYTAYIQLPEGLDGAVIQAVAIDNQGIEGASQPRFIKKISDTVKPKPYILSPASGDIVTIKAGNNGHIRLLMAVEDIGNPLDRHAYMRLIREQQDETGTWVTLDEDQVELLYNDSTLLATEPVSEPENFYYIHSYNYSNGRVFSHDDSGVQRVRIEAWVETTADKNPEVVEAIVEVGMKFSRNYFIKPGANASNGTAKTVYYNAVSQYAGKEKSGALVASWSSLSPYNVEKDLGNFHYSDLQDDGMGAYTGVYYLGIANIDEQANGDTFAYSENLNSTAEIFTGTIAEITADQDYVLAAKSGINDATNGSEPSFVSSLKVDISRNPETGRIDEYGQSELLIFNKQNGDNQFGLPYLMVGRADLPFEDV